MEKPTDSRRKEKEAQLTSLVAVSCASLPLFCECGFRIILRLVNLALPNVPMGITPVNPHRSVCHSEGDVPMCAQLNANFIWRFDNSPYVTRKLVWRISVAVKYHLSSRH